MVLDILLPFQLQAKRNLSMNYSSTSSSDDDDDELKSRALIRRSTSGSSIFDSLASGALPRAHSRQRQDPIVEHRQSEPPEHPELQRGERHQHQPRPVRKQSLSFILNRDSSPDLRLYSPRHESTSPGPSVHAFEASDSHSYSASLSTSSSRPGSVSDGHTVTDATFTTVPTGVKKRRRRRASVPCDICGRVFGEAAALRKHRKVVHEKKKDFECEECGRAFAEKSNLKKHTQARHGTAENPHPCPDCGKIFNFSDGLRRHINNCHLELRPYKCDVAGCGASFKQRTHLQKHKLRVDHSSGTPQPN